MKRDETNNDETAVVETQSVASGGCTFGGVIFSMIQAGATHEVTNQPVYDEIPFDVPVDTNGNASAVCAKQGIGTNHHL